MTPARALGHRKRRAARRLRRMKIQWHEKDGRWWLTASHWPRGAWAVRVFTVDDAAP